MHGLMVTLPLQTFASSVKAANRLKRKNTRCPGSWIMKINIAFLHLQQELHYRYVIDFSIILRQSMAGSNPPPTKGGPVPQCFSY